MIVRHYIKKKEEETPNPECIHSNQLNEHLVKDSALLETQERLLFLKVMFLLD